MNSELKKTNIKAKEDVTLKLIPSDALEIEYFKVLFSGEVVFETEPKTDNIIIKKKETAD